ncbi:MAG: hypothetical protein ACT4QD_03685 [Acidobacteriota bacterium]
MGVIRALLLYASTPDNSTFSYQRAWPRHFQAHARFSCTAVNLGDRRWAAWLSRAWLSSTFRGDVVLLLHSVFSNACFASDRLVDALARLAQPKVYFIGNEYKLMPEKMVFCDRLRLALLISQTQSPRVHEIYRRRLGCDVVGVPNTGLDPALFTPAVPVADRPIDLGYRAADAPPYLGHQERRAIAEFFQARADHYGLSVDISLNASDRLAEPAWAAFLNRCRGQLGTEAGGDYFDLDDGSRIQVNEYLTRHPDATHEDVYARFFRDRVPTPLRILSGRQVEAAGTKTVQVLFEGEYDGYFRPDEHYIALKKDFSNADEAIGKFRDGEFSRRIADQAHALVHEQFTYDRLIDRVHAAVTPLV